MKRKKKQTTNDKRQYCPTAPVLRRECRCNECKKGR